MMEALGHTVYLYAGTKNEAPVEANFKRLTTLWGEGWYANE